ncbi:MAG: prepilin-type N-terminal cleavage/methylation domain-containing protein [Halieaceae bacterium]|nr:prepilin-type N-terminal cleavage/methylation domain-containing protein [Halieaceae bacterium]
MRAQRHRGFSLIEILVAVFVIVMVASVVMLNVSSPKRDRLAEDAAQQFERTLNYALEEAEYANMVYGLFVERENSGMGNIIFTYKQIDDNQWVGVNDQVLSQAVRFDTELEIDLEIEGTLVEINARPVEAEQWQPVLRLLPSGEMSAGRLIVEDKNDTSRFWRVEWTIFGGAKATLEQP